ncbi:MAG: chromosome segregation protein SMC [Verrucomicrobia bacterium]|nr:chromosome segregation protein SMC [Verrucomicrobiota bacterium]
MYLKNLTVLGFKSFADKTSLNFLPGVSAIVGPNGCGKSNISDAIRWVLGEQSAKALRGGEMADVIFTGTDSRRPLGMAEVSLTIGDVDTEHLKAAGVEISFNEVTITRRVFRDGGSEYFINKTACRLKDIQQLFMGTGVGRTSYSIMAQGNITQLLSSKPEDRRVVFEEAAGITKFKAQKRESLRKLDSTEQNLLRVSDLIREVKRQIGSLQRQAGKARRYKQISVELQHLDTQLARHHYDVLLEGIEACETGIEKLRAEAESCSESVLQHENEISKLRALLNELNQQIHQTEQQAQELKSRIDKNEGLIQFNEERLHELERQNAKALGDITQGEERRAAVDQELASVSERCETSNATLDHHRNVLETRRAAAQTLDRDLTAQQEHLRKTQADAFAAAQKLTRLRNESNAIDLQRQGNLVRMEKLSAEKIQLEEERTGLEERLTEFATNVEAEKRSVQVSRGTIEERQQRLRGLQQELDNATQVLDNLLRKQAEHRSQMSLLEQLQTDYEGFSAGTVAALKESESALGSLTDRIDVPDQYVTAIETALGHRLQLVLAGHPEEARNTLANLIENRKGRASIAALSLLENIDFSSRNSVSTNGSSGDDASGGTLSQEATGLDVEALRVVQVEASVKPLIHRLLGQTRIVPDLATATDGWNRTQGLFDYVTLSGEMLDRNGIYTGGAGNGNGHASILGRKNQIADLRNQLSKLQHDVGEASRDRGALQSEQTSLQASLQEAQTDLQTKEVSIATHEGEFNALKNSLRSLHQKIDTVVFEIQSLAAQEQEGAEKRNQLAAEIRSFEELEQIAQRDLAESNARLEGLREQREAANTALAESKIAATAEEQMYFALNQQQKSLAARLKDVAEMLELRRSEASSFVSRRTQYETEIQESRSQIESLQHDRQQINTRIANVQAQKDGQEREISSREQTLREQRNRLTQIQQSRSAREVEIAQKNMAVENLRQRIQEKYQVRLDDIRSECITITIADEGPPKVETLTPDEMASSGGATDWDAVTEQVAALQNRIDEMGPVNLVAIEEYEETEQRFQFLTVQHDDLVKAKQQLLEVINRINTQTKQMFAETFNQIRENFRLLFVEVFDGGKADLRLVDEGDVLESGIEIVAKPPGKQLQGISLLSGGEQTMTAVALLFSIYQVKPSPFCVLDELDAPLDESNINRFIRILQRFLQNSQFVIITHNKRTIGMADVLYGVTMQEHGVSKIVSVKFHKAGEAVSDHAPVPLDTQVSSPIEEEEDKLYPASETLDVAMAK